MKSGVVAAILMAAVGPVLAQPINLSAWMTADNAFEASVSSSPTTVGSSFLSGGSWPTTFTGVVQLPGPGTYYLWVRAEDFGPPAMFIGRFTLDHASGTFSNGTQALVTNTTNWLAYSEAQYSGGGPGTVPADLGPNGAGPWGFYPAMTPDARFLWHNAGVIPVTYFRSTITVVPAPASMTLLLGALAVSARRRR